MTTIQIINIGQKFASAALIRRGRTVLWQSRDYPYGSEHPEAAAFRAAERLGLKIGRIVQGSSTRVWNGKEYTRRA